MPSNPTVSPLAAVSLIVLLFLPATTLLRLAQSFDPRLLWGYAVGISLVAYFTYQHDKRRAQEGGWRTPESILHGIEFAGGWPGAFIAQRALRHKISKTTYQVKFWMIVAVHEAALFDFAHGWRYAKRLAGLFAQ